MTTSATKPASPRHFSMIRDFHAADFFTLANGGCGTAAIFLAMKHMREPTPGTAGGSPAGSPASARSASRPRSTRAKPASRGWRLGQPDDRFPALW